MHFLKNIKNISLLFPLIAMVSSCNMGFKKDDYMAYFGGEVINSSNPYVLFCKDDNVLDTIKLDAKNRFFIQFDSLAPGLYNFKNEPEYQYVYFDKNDSIMVHVNSKEFDESIIFCGRGAEKNNFLMELFLKNEEDKNKIFEVFGYDFDKFSKTVNQNFAKTSRFYQNKKQEIKWSDDFDMFAKAGLDFNYYSKKELYPLVHRIRTGEDVIEKLPKDYYNYRKNIDFNNSKLLGYSPYVMYLSYMLDNMGAINYHNHFSEEKLALKTSINKMQIADTLIKNEKLKNILLNNIAFSYLLEDQNIINNQAFLKTYHKLSTDKSRKNEITTIGNAIRMMKVGNPLPEVVLIDKHKNKVSSASFAKTNTVIFFWTESAKSHFEAAHKKLKLLKTIYPSYQFVAININDSEEEWKKLLSKYNYEGIIELHCSDFENIKNKWAINKIYRTIILDDKGLIKNAFTNIFDSKFEDNLK